MNKNKKPLQTVILQFAGFLKKMREVLTVFVRLCLKYDYKEYSFTAFITVFTSSIPNEHMLFEDDREPGSDGYIQYLFRACSLRIVRDRLRS